MSTHESLYVLSRGDDIPTAYLSGEKNLYAFYGVENFSSNTSSIRSEHDKAAAILKKSRKATKVQKQMLKNMLRYGQEVLANDFNRTLYDIEVHQRHIIGVLPEASSIKQKPESELHHIKQESQKKIDNIKEQIAMFVTERHELHDGKIPAKYSDIFVQIKKSEDLAYEVPKSNINVALLRRKLKAEVQGRKMIGDIVKKRQMIELASLRKQALQYCQVIHCIDREIQNRDQEIL